MSEDTEPLRNTLSIHVDIPDAATRDEADGFMDALGSFVGLWMAANPDRGEWDPFVYAHTEACEHSDHCYGPGSRAEARIRGGGGVVSVLGIGGALALVLGMGDRPRPSRRVFVPDEVVEVGCRSYRVVSVAPDGEPTLERVDTERIIG